MRDDWNRTRLADLCLKIQDGTHFSPSSTSGPYRYLTSRNVRFGFMDLDSSGWISESEHRAIYRRCDVRHGDVLLTKDGANTGNAALNPLVEEFSLLSSVAFLRPNPAFATASFLLQALLSRDGQTRMEDIMSGNAIRRLTLAKIKAFEISVPPLPEQRRIAEILDTLDEAIRKTEQVIKKLQQMKQGLLHDLLTRGIDESGELRNPQRHPEQFKDSPLGRIPKEWDTIRLGEASNVVRGSTPRPAKDPRYFGGAYVPWITVGELSKDEWPYLDSTATKLTKLGASFSRRLEAGTLVLSNSGYGCGVPKLLSISGCANDGIAAFLGIEQQFEPLFIYYFLFSRISELRTRVARGVDQPNLNTDLLREYRAVLPPQQEQQAISQVIFSTAERGREELDSLKKLKQLKQGLMDDLLTGRVRVNVEEAVE